MRIVFKGIIILFCVIESDIIISFFQMKRHIVRFRQLPQSIVMIGKGWRKKSFYRNYQQFIGGEYSLNKILERQALLINIFYLLGASFV